MHKPNQQLLLYFSVTAKSFVSPPDLDLDLTSNRRQQMKEEWRAFAGCSTLSYLTIKPFSDSNLTH